MPTAVEYALTKKTKMKIKPANFEKKLASGKNRKSSSGEVIKISRLG